MRSRATCVERSNLSKNHLRHRAVERSYLARHAGQVVEGRTDPDVPTYQTIRGALLALPVRQRAAIVLRYFDAGVGHVAIGCFESSIQWPPGPGEFHRLTLGPP